MTMTTQTGSIADVLATTWMISSDSHIIEPPDIWEGLVPVLGDRAPRVVSEADGDWWYVDGRKTMSFIGIQTGDRFVKDAIDKFVRVLGAEHLAQFDRLIDDHSPRNFGAIT